MLGEGRIHRDHVMWLADLRDDVTHVMVGDLVVS